jgi:hypothetical protein
VVALVNLGYEIQFGKAHRLTETTYMNHIVKEETDTITLQELQQKGWMCIKLNMTNDNQYNNTICTAVNKQPRPSLMIS